MHLWQKYAAPGGEEDDLGALNVSLSNTRNIGGILRINSMLLLSTSFSGVQIIHDRHLQIHPLLHSFPLHEPDQRHHYSAIGSFVNVSILLSLDLIQFAGPDSHQSYHAPLHIKILKSIVATDNQNPRLYRGQGLSVLQLPSEHLDLSSLGGTMLDRVPGDDELFIGG